MKPQKKNPAAVALGRIRSVRKAAAARVNGRLGGRPRKIQREYRDSDGYWIELMPGWQNGNDPGTHGIVEDTKRAAYRVLTMARPCDCGECRALIARAASSLTGGAR